MIVKEPYLRVVLENPPHIPDSPRFKIIETGSQKGKTKLVEVTGFSFVVSRRRGERVYWRCSVRNKTDTCPATVVQNGSQYPSFTPKPHSHLAEPGLASSVEIRAEVKTQARADVFKSGHDIVDEVQRDHDPDMAGGFDKPENLIRAANRAREGNRPKHPKDLDFENAYMKKESVKTFVRKLMALPFLPAQSIRPMFLEIEARVPVGGKLEQLVTYYHRQWISHAVFTPESWSMFNIAVRTNNHVEGWHHRLNNKCRERTLGMYKLIPILYDEAELLPIQMRLVIEKKLTSYVRKRASAKQEEIFSLWRLYKQGALSASETLSRSSKLHGPVV